MIAENKGFFGFFKTQVKSPIKGKISNVSSTTGQIMISEPDIPIEIDAYIDGEIIEIIDNRIQSIKPARNLYQKPAYI